MRYLTMLLLIPALLLVIGASSKSGPGIGTVEVQVLVGTVPLPGASVALDLNNNGVWDEHFGEPRDWTDNDGIVTFSDVVSIENPGGDDPSGVIDWSPTRIMMGNVRGSVGAPDVQVDFVLPAGSGTASLGLYDLRGRCLAQTHGPGDLALSVPGGLSSGVYFLRLSAAPAAPVSQRITSVGVRTQTIRANKVSAAEAVAAGWTDHDKSQKSDDPPHHINLIVAHDDHATVVQPEIIEPGLNSFTVVLEPLAPEGFVYIPPGTFMMGSPWDEPGWGDERPQHQVSLTRGFFMSKYEVTEEWWDQVYGGGYETSQLPKNWVSWDDAVRFCIYLSDLEGLTPAYTYHGHNGNVTWHQDANGYRLPTEAEWEYACRAGSTTAFANGPITHIDCLPLDLNLDAMGWYCGNASNRQNVGQKQANAWGLYDMHGNLYEWVWCGFRRQYTSDAVVDPVYNVAPGEHRMIRGGSWPHSAMHCQSAVREHYSPYYGGSTLGFRLVRSAF